VKIGKLELTQEKMIIVIAGAVAVAALMIYIVFYAPLLEEIKKKYLECKLIESDVIDIRNIIETAGKVYGGRILPTEEDVHHAIDELTEHGGKMEGVNYISIRPKEIRQKKGEKYKIMPIELEVETSYEKLGIFLGSLDDMEKGLLKVKSFDMNCNEKHPGTFITDLIVEVYISDRKSK